MTPQQPFLRRLLHRGVSRILIGSAVGQGTLLAVSPVLTRLYTPSDFAAFAVLTALSSILGGAGTLSWERAIVIPRSRLQVKSIVLLGLVSIVLTSVFIATIAFCFRHFLDQLFGTSMFGSLWWLLPATTLVLGLDSIAASWLVRRRMYPALAFRKALQGLAQSAWGVLLGLAALAPIGLVSSLMAGRAASLMGIVPWNSVRAARFPKARVLAAVAFRYRKFPLVTTWSRLVNSTGLQLPTLLIVSIYGSPQAGLFALTLRVLSAPVGMVVEAVSQYFEAEFSQRARAHLPTLSSFIRKTSLRIGLIIFPGALLAVSILPLAFEVIFGQEWREAGILAQIMLPTYVAQFVVAPVSRALVILERQGTQLGWDLARLAFVGLAILLPSALGASLVVVLASMTVVQVLLYATLLFFCLRAARERDSIHR